MKNAWTITTLAATVLGLAFGPAHADIYLGAIYTGNPEQPKAEAVQVRDGRIVYVGDAAGIEAVKQEGERVIDLKDATLFPGFTDAHAHFLGIGQRELSLNLEGVPSLAELVKNIAKQAASIPEGQLIFGRGWIETHWPEERFPTRQDLDPVSPKHPVVLIRADGHALVANSLALKKADITAQTKAPVGGDILKDDAGEPTGMLIDKAMGLVAGLQTEPTMAEKEEAYRKASEVYSAYGWTGVHDMSVPVENVPIMERLATSGDIPIRVYVSANKEAMDTLLTNGPRIAADGRIITRAVKLYMDGALGSRGASLLEPYSDAKGTGLLLMTQEEAAPVLEKALRLGVQINTHAIGDRANRLTLDWYGVAFKSVPVSERRIAVPRWRVEHAQIVNPADIPRFRALGVIPSMQPSHAIGDLHFAPSRLGQKRLNGAYAWASFVKSGSIIAGGSDAPVERGDPLVEFYATVARKDLKGFSGKGWHPEEALDRETALKLFTSWAAEASFQENDLGTIEVGKLADFTVFDKDIMTIPEAEIPKARAVMTIVGGKIVYQADNAF